VKSPRPLSKSFAIPDEVVTFPKGFAENVTLGEVTVGRLVQQPGWRWSEHIKPIAGTESCQFHHTGVAISGRGMVRMNDGTEVLISPGDVLDIPPDTTRGWWATSRRSPSCGVGGAASENLRWATGS
jgi:quercetin dioxygenase-like cupin family protein